MSKVHVIQIIDILMANKQCDRIVTCKNPIS